jgi:hypothetical protein
LNAPVLDHLDLIRGMVTGYKTPGSPDYAGEWPRNLDWLRADGTTPPVSDPIVPAAAKNLSAEVIKTFNANAGGWMPTVSTVDGTTFLKMSYRIPAVTASQYVRVRGTNMPASVPYETDASGNPLSDIYTNANDRSRMTIPCTTTGTNVPANGVEYTRGNAPIDGCPAHMVTATAPSPIAGQVAVGYDVAAWADLWSYSNPVFIEVAGSTVVRLGQPEPVVKSAKASR